MLAVAAVTTANAIEIPTVKAMIDAEGLMMDLFNEEGSYIGEAAIYPENWNGEEMTQYVVRFTAGTDLVEVKNWAFDSVTGEFFETTAEGAVVSTLSVTPVGGQFVTGLRGTLEKWDLGGDTESVRVVFRKEGKFVTWVNVDAQITTGWNTYVNAQGEVRDRFEVRWAAGTALGGQLINSVDVETMLKDKNKAFHMVEGKACPVLAMRDTQDGINNGKFLTSVYGQRVARDGEYWCYYYVTLNNGNQKLVTSGKLKDLNDF